MNRFLIVVLLIHLASSNSFNELPKFLTKKSCTFEGDGCNCIVRVRGECCCKGRKIVELPSNLTTTMRALFMYNTSITEVTNDFFSRYLRLEELEIDDSAALEHFDSSCLANLTNLRKLFVLTVIAGTSAFRSITKCRSLREISGKLLMNNAKLQSVILRNNGLHTIPSLRMTEAHKLEVDIDLSGNQIKFIGNNKVREVRARTLKLNNNKILEIEGYAFNGSSFVKLAIDNNLDLSDLSMDAFKNVKELHHLDLSFTSINVLPINGLKNLKTLKLKNVPTLKRIPSVLSFTKLETAHFTYPHHCCLFNYVDDVVVNENGKFQKNAKEIHKRICAEKRTAGRQKRRIAERDALSSGFLKEFFDEWMQELEGSGTDIGVDYGSDLPPFSQIGADTCDSVVEEVRSYYKNITCYPSPHALNPCENIVGYSLLRIAIWVVWVMAIAGNVAVLVILGLAYERRMKVHYMYMINMAVADMITGVYLACLAIQDARTSDEYYRHAVSWQTGWGCKAAGSLAVFAAELGIISMFLIAFEMSYNTRKAFLGKKLSPRVAVFLMLIGWLFALLMAFLPWVGVSSYSTSSICLPLRAETVFDKAYLIFGLIFNLSSFIAMALCYGFIVKMLKENKTREEDKALIMKMALLVCTNLVCWFPTLFFGLTASMGIPLISLSNAKILLVFFFPINSFANPFLYVRVKSKTIPVLRRITTTGRSLNTLSNFYNSQPPGPSKKEEASNRLTVTQTTSLNSTPRGSNCSSHRTSDALFADCDPNKRSRQLLCSSSSPRVSFQCDASTSPPTPQSERGKRFSFLKRLVSEAPEVSDLSEHSSESHHEHVPTPRNRMRFFPNRTSARHRDESHRSNGQDSGRGSLASSVDPNNERSSLVSAQEGPASPPQPILTANAPPIVLPFSAGAIRNQLIFQPKRPDAKEFDRRRSAPAIPLLVVSECSNEE
ncbi:unnamed protein product [Caenorhabditis auriculariae]|uniref:G-protein coupled receptors family 1 profile domain-containing protein n=1 Tax=Caenorhabditis auriculariae TaxID=2777116 RepID=A0A8S1HIF4_9PELO|nr:unnamed protein product [Caenorhabditis auriculariae]